MSPKRFFISMLTIVAAFALLSVAGCGSSVDLDVSRKFQEAQAAFDRAQSPEDFLRAAALYREIRDLGVVSGAVLYNQGNALMEAGQRGRAIAAYREAKRYRPRDPYLEANLRFALGTAGPVARQRSIVDHLFFWQDWLSYSEKFYLTAAVAACTFLLGVLGLFLRRPLVSRLALAGCALLLLLACSAGLDWYRYDYVRHGVIVEQEVIARKGNSAGYEPAFTEPLAEGAEFRLVQRRGDWLLARLAGGQEGWIDENAAVLY